MRSSAAGQGNSIWRERNIHVDPASILVRGVVGVVMFLILAPGVGAIALAWALGAYAAASGAVLTALAVRLRTAQSLAA